MSPWRGLQNEMAIPQDNSITISGKTQPFSKERSSDLTLPKVPHVFVKSRRKGWLERFKKLSCDGCCFWPIGFDMCCDYLVAVRCALVVRVNDRGPRTRVMMTARA